MKEEIWYVVPEIEIRVHESWIELIRYCQNNLPYGDLKVNISNARPGKRLKEIPSIRFDKPMASRTDGIYYLIASLDFRVHEYWINLIKWCQDYFMKGELELRLINSCPTDLLSVKQEVRFDKPDTIPKGIPLNFTK